VKKKQLIFKLHIKKGNRLKNLLGDKKEEVQQPPPHSEYGQPDS